MYKRAPAFTIVELLIVIVIIAILAAISIVAYRGIQDRANASSAQSLATQAAKALKLYFAEHDTYPASLTDAGLTNTTGLQYSYSNTASPKTFCITATTNSKSYYQNTTTALTPSEGGCAGHGQGGVGAVTNLVPNPSFEGNMTGWALNGYGTTGTGAHELNGGHSGDRYRSYTLTGSATAIYNIGPYIQVGSLNATSSYQGIAYVRTSVSMPYRIVAELRNSSGSAIATRYGATVVTSAGVWTRLSINITPTANLDRLTFCIYSDGRNWAPGEKVDFDAAMLIEGSVAPPNYADGNSSSWVWNGTENNSTSTGPALLGSVEYKHILEDCNGSILQEI